MPPYLLFCESPFEKNKVDPDFEDEFFFAKQHGFLTLLFNFEDLTSIDRFDIATKKIKPTDSLTTVIYRGWMLTPTQYTTLYNDLLAKNYQLINAPNEYQNCHYLPDSLEFITPYTPLTVYEPLMDETSIEKLLEKVKIFENQSIIIKDYVKSEKHDWDTACFVKDASDTENFKTILNNFIQLRDKYLNKGIVVRAFIQLNDLTIHSKSGMPLTEEYRLFFCNQKLLGIYDYWEEGEYDIQRPDTKEFEALAKTIKSNFFSMDIAKEKNGGFVIIELGDGQVSGLSEKLDRDEFYNCLKNC